MLATDPSPTIVLLHSFGGNAKSWNFVVAEIDLACLVPNLPGFGGTTSLEEELTVDSYAEFILAMLEPLERFVLVGHSMGGKFALAVASLRPNGLASLVLIAPSPPTPEPMTDQNRRELLDGWKSRSIAEKTVESIVRAPISPETKEAAVRGYLESSEPAWRSWLEIGSRENISDRMSKIQVPIVVLTGTEDPILGASVQERATLPWLTDFRVLEAEGAGHLVPIENPRAVVDAIKSALG